jgi:hypothetical protein
LPGSGRGSSTQFIASASDEIRYENPSIVSLKEFQRPLPSPAVSSTPQLQEPSFSDMKVTCDQMPLPVQHNTALPMSASKAGQKTTLAIRQHLSMAPSKHLIAYKPTTVQSHQGLTFARANAIVYGCVTMAAMRFVLMNIGDSIRAYDVALEMAFALFVGLILCVVLHLGSAGSLLRVVGNLPRNRQQGFY